MKHTGRIIAVVAFLCVGLANTDVLWAVHMHQHQHSSRGDASGTKPHPVGRHDAGKCPICIYLATAKAVPFDFTPPVGLVTGPAEKPVSLKTSPVPVVSLASSVPRGPPSASL